MLILEHPVFIFSRQVHLWPLADAIECMAKDISNLGLADMPVRFLPFRLRAAPCLAKSVHLNGLSLCTRNGKTGTLSIGRRLCWVLGAAPTKRLRIALWIIL